MSETKPDETKPAGDQANGAQAQGAKDQESAAAPAKGRSRKAEKVAPQQYQNAGLNVGQYAPEARFGIVQADGSVKPTGKDGKDEPKPGERGTIIVQAGDVVTRSVRLALGLED